MTAFQLQCAACKIPLEGPDDPEPEDVLRCPRCGVEDRTDNVVAEVREYAKDRMAERVNTMLRDATRGKKFLDVVENPRPQRVYRFMIDLDLDG